MNLLYTARARLLAGALVVVASSALTINSMQQAEAQPRGAAWERSSQWLACGNSTVQAMRRVSRSAISSDTGASVTRSLLDLRNVNTAPAQLGLAAGACRDERVRDRRHNIPAYLCVGEAGLMSTVASVDTGSNAQNAYCAYHSAALLARTVGNASQLSEAHVGRARALQALGAGQAEVVEAYGLAISADPNASTARFALARHYVRSGDTARAQDLLVRTEGANLVPVVGGIDSAVAIIELARARPGAPDIRLLRAAERAAPAGNVGVNSALGAAYADVDPVQARQYLRAATDPGAVAQSPTEAALQLDAYYHRSIFETRDRSYAEAARFADLAGNQPHALRQACLVRLVQGGTAIYNYVQNANGTWQEFPAQGRESCTRVGATPEGRLLVGMFWLRRAQYLAARHGTLTQSGSDMFFEAVNNAGTAFSAGRDALTDNSAKLNWPGHNPDVTLRQMLTYGTNLFQYYSSGCRSGAALQGQREAEEIFEAYRIIQPISAPRRCVPERS